MRLALLVVLTVLSTTTARAGAGVDEVRKIKVGKVERAYRLFIPPTAPSAAAPLLLVLHGRGGTGRQIREHAGFDEEAKRLGVVVAYPDAIDRRWNDARQLTLKPDLPRLGTDDVGFLLALVDELVAKGLVDRERVFVAGHSNGAMMALTLACTHAERFAGIGVVAGNLPKTECALARPVSAVFFHGTDDPLVPYAGGGIGPRGKRGFVLGADDTVARFAQAASCAPPTRKPAIDAVKDDGTSLIVEERAGCSVPIERYIIDKGGHGWPGRPPRFLRGTEEIDATQAIARFFFERAVGTTAAPTSRYSGSAHR